MLPPNASDGGLGNRLDSWKEIAAYLSRDARTVQRWEKSEGLPVHRHVHEAQGSVYAYTAEIDIWLENRKRSPLADQEARPEAALPVAAPPRVPGQRRNLWTAAGLCLVLGGGLTVAWWLRHPKLLPFHERDWVLVEGFENHTGEAVLEGALRNALELELNNSAFVYVVPRERVEDTLRLMRKPGAKLDPALAREVSVRDGGIRALVTGKTEKYGNEYVFSVQLIDPVRNVPIATRSEAAPTPDQMWPAVRRLSNWVRESLGEAADGIQRSNQELEKVTTPSLNALQLFSEADRANKRREWQVSAQLLREAVADDPAFASAHTWLAWDLKNLEDPGWEQEIQRAVELSNTVSERERYFIRASYYLLRGQEESAIPVLEALVRRYPDHYFGNENLAIALGRVGRMEEAKEARERAADLRPNDYTTNAAAAVFFMQMDVDRGIKFAQRARMLAEIEAPDPPSDLDVGVMLSRFDELWWREDVVGAFAELQRQLQHPRGGAWPANMAMRYFRLGRYSDAKAMLQQDPAYLSMPLSQASLLFRLAFYSGKAEEARGILNDVLRSDRRRFLGMGLGFPALQLGVPTWEESLGVAGSVLPEAANLAKGTLSLEQGRNAEAIALFQTAWDQHRKEGIYGPLIAEGLSTAFERSGNTQGAVKALEQASAERLQLPPQWLRNEARLAGLYRQLHKNDEARKIEHRLRNLLAVADPAHPILNELNARKPVF